MSSKTTDINTDNEQLHRDIAAATATAWPTFAKEHPALAQVIDQRMLGEHLTHSLAGDPAFIAAYRAAREASVTQKALTDLVNGFVAPALRRLL